MTTEIIKILTKRRDALSKRVKDFKDPSCIEYIIDVLNECIRNIHDLGLVHATENIESIAHISISMHKYKEAREYISVLSTISSLK